MAAQWRVSRQTVHAWLARYQLEGLEGLADRSHRPGSCRHQMSGEVEAMVLELRRSRPYWGTLSGVCPAATGSPKNADPEQSDIRARMTPITAAVAPLPPLAITATRRPCSRPSRSRLRAGNTKMSSSRSVTPSTLSPYTSSSFSMGGTQAQTPPVAQPGQQ